MSKITLITITVLLGFLSLASATTQSFRNTQDEVNHLYSAFKGWVGQTNKQYGIEELAIRFYSWKQNHDFVQEQNARDLGFKLEMNHFGDMTPEEFSALHLGYDHSLKQVSDAQNQKEKGQEGLLGSTGPRYTANATDLPKAVDWRLFGAVTPVKNQAKCGGCWSFSVSGALEGLYAIKTNQIATLSEQQLIDCSTSYGNNGCGGGVMEFAFNYTQNNGLQLESDYVYTAQNDTCKYDASKVVFKNTGFVIVPANDSMELRAAVAQQPISVAIEASSLTLQLFKSGVLSEGCSTNLDHAVLIVGYDTTPDGQDYWIVKNSWSHKWGLNGYINIAAGDQNGGLGMCGINMYATYPTL